MSEMNYNIPELTESQKGEIKALMDDYYNHKGDKLFVSLLKMAREGYGCNTKLTNTASQDPVVDGCINASNKYYLNGATFAQMIWMGRSYSDFANHKDGNPTKAITNVFKGTDMNGYYFDFLGAQLAYGIKRGAADYYALNTYMDNDGTTRRNVTFDDAGAMADELYRKGCEIPYHKVDVGDLVFFRATSLIDESADGKESTDFRYITHVGIVYGKTAEGTPIILEFDGGYSDKLGKCCMDQSGTSSLYGMVRGAHLSNRVAMCARHPAAYGVADNVVPEFTKYRNTNFEPDEK